MLIVPDNDVGGVVQTIRWILESDELHEYWDSLHAEFLEFDDLGLSPESPDGDVWTSCEDQGVVLITGNRSGGAGSLDEAIQLSSTSDSLPVITIADAQRVRTDANYAEACALRLIDYLERVDDYRGTGRLFIP